MAWHLFLFVGKVIVYVERLFQREDKNKKGLCYIRPKVENLSKFLFPLARSTGHGLLIYQIDGKMLQFFVDFIVYFFIMYF